MIPVLWSVGNFNVYSFGFFLSFAFILSTFIIWKRGHEELREEEYLDIYLIFSLVSLLTARLVYIIFNFSDFGGNILKYFLVRETPGLSLIGGMTGGFLYLWWVILKKKLEFWHILDLFCLAASFGLVFAKIGEQLGGGGFGRETSSFLGVRIIGLPGLHHPTEFYESIIFLILSINLVILYKKIQRNKWPQGLVFCVFSLVVSLTIFLIEFLKVNTLYLYGLNIRQIVTLIIIGVLLKPLIRRLIIIKVLLKDKSL